MTWTSEPPNEPGLWLSCNGLGTVPVLHYWSPNAVAHAASRYRYHLGPIPDPPVFVAEPETKERRLFE